MSATRRFRVSCLYLITALGLMAATATGAQAKGDWRIEGANTAATVEFTVEKDGTRDFKLLSTTGAVDVEILCQEIVVDDGLLFPPKKETESGKALAVFLFSQCKTFIAGSESPPCKPAEPFVFKVKGLLIKHNKLTYILFEPDENGVFGTPVFGEECMLISAGVTGRYVVEDGNEPLENEAVKHLLVPAPSALFAGQNEGGVVLPNSVMFFGIHPAKIDLSLWFKLSGGNAGKKWSGLAL